MEAANNHSPMCKSYTHGSFHRFLLDVRYKRIELRRVKELSYLKSIISNLKNSKA